jgi:hypothetical protein
MTRFTVTGSAELEATICGQLAAVCNDVRQAIDPKLLDCLVLGGGYGRGEGGALVQGGRELPYNDYDLVLVHHARRASSLAALGEIERRHSRATGLHVEILPLHRRRLLGLPRALTWYELGRGHRVLWGDERVLRPLVLRRLDQVHSAEWGRLLMNRGAGLVFARWVLAKQPCSVLSQEDPDAFVTRQLQKAWLALGDVWLAQRGDYHHMVRQRRRRFKERLTERPAWGDAYERAIDFKLSPTAPWSPEQQRAELAELARYYVPALRSRPAAPFRPLVGLWATARHLAPEHWLTLEPWTYPRDRIRLALSAELEGDRARFERLVGSPARLIRLWSRYG